MLGKFPRLARPRPIRLVGSRHGTARRGAALRGAHSEHSFIVHAWQPSSSGAVHREAAQTGSSAPGRWRAYLWSSRASSINISASLAFNYTIIEGLGLPARSSGRVSPFGKGMGEGTRERLTSLALSERAGCDWLLESYPLPLDRSSWWKRACPHVICRRNSRVTQRGKEGKFGSSGGRDTFCCYRISGNTRALHLFLADAI